MHVTERDARVARSPTPDRGEHLAGTKRGHSELLGEGLARRAAVLGELDGAAD